MITQFQTIISIKTAYFMSLTGIFMQNRLLKKRQIGEFSKLKGDNILRPSLNLFKIEKLFNKVAN
jgi:hypothetical protein